MRAGLPEITRDRTVASLAAASSFFFAGDVSTSLRREPYRAAPHAVRAERDRGGDLPAGGDAARG